MRQRALQLGAVAQPNDMWPSVSGAGVPRWNQMVTASLPTEARPSSGSMYGSSPSTRVNHAALARGSRTARLKWPTGPTVKSGMMRLFPETHQARNARPGE